MNRFAFLFILIVAAASAYAVSKTLISSSEGNLASVFSSQAKIIYADCISTFSNQPQHAFTITSAHLNTDTEPDAIIAYTQGEECGTAGCIHELCIADQTKGYLHVPLGLAVHQLNTKETLNGGMHDLMLNNDPELMMTWDGSKYILN